MSQRGSDPGRQRSVVQSWRGWVILAVLLVGCFLMILLYEHPAHLLSEDGHLAAWRAGVDTVVRAHTVGCVDPYEVHVTRLPGFGTVGRICVTRGTAPGAIAVTFEPATGSYDLVYAAGLPPPPDECSCPLGARWWEVTKVNPSTLSCPRGFTFDPAP